MYKWYSYIRHLGPILLWIEARVWPFLFFHLLTTLQGLVNGRILVYEGWVYVQVLYYGVIFECEVRRDEGETWIHNTNTWNFPILVISFIMSSTSSMIMFCIDFLPNPKSLKCLSVKRRCSAQNEPSVKKTPVNKEVLKP